MRTKLLVTLLSAAGLMTCAQSAAMAASTASAAASLDACCNPGDQDFPKVGGNLGNQNYSSLKQINKGLVKRLGATWVNRIEGGINTGNNQSTAVAVDGVLYLESAFGNVVAVDGKTGVTKWKYTQTRGTLTRRGVAVAKDMGLVFTLGNDNWVIALDKDTGHVVWERQHGGWGNVEKVAIVYVPADAARNRSLGMLYVGTNDGNRNAGLALNATNGDLVWHFWGAPGPGDPGEFDENGNKTWEGTSYLQGGASPWIHPAVDPELNLVYWNFGNARGNRSSQDGSLRGGDNRFSNSLVAVDATTGAYKWHFQSIHHGIWDMDNTMAPVFADVEVNGVLRKLVIHG